MINVKYFLTFNPKDSLFPHYSDIGFGDTGHLNSRTSFNSACLSLAVATAIILSAYLRGRGRMHIALRGYVYTVREFYADFEVMY